MYIFAELVAFVAFRVRANGSIFSAAVRCV